MSTRQNGSESADSANQKFPGHARQKQHHDRDAGQNERGAQVGLEYNQSYKNQRNEAGAPEGAPLVDLVEPGGEKPGQEETSTGLAISEGWRVKKSPKRIQRWV